MGSVVVVLALVLFVGLAMLWPARRSADFYVADRKVSPRRAGAAGAGTVAGLLTVGAAGQTFASAEAILIAGAGLLLGCMVVGSLLAPRLRRFGGHTVGDFLAARFGQPARLVGAALTFAASFFLLTASLSIAGPILASVVDITSWQSLFAATAVIGAAVVSGGVRSLIASQGVQYTIAVLGCLTLVAFSAFQSGTLPDISFPNTEALPVEAPLGLGLIFAVALPILLTAIQTAALPMLSVGASVATGLAAAAYGWTIVFSLVLFLGVLMFGPAALQAMGDLTNTPTFSSASPIETLPPALAGLAIAGVLAITLSLGQAALFSATSALSHDLWGEIRDRRSAGERRVFGARLLAIGIALAAGWQANGAISNPGAMFSWALALSAAGGFAPLLLGLWWSRCNATGALAGAISGAIIVAASFVIDPSGAVVENAAATGVLGSFLVAILGSLVTAPPPAHQADLVRRLRGGSARTVAAPPASARASIGA
jgi:Na+(H+)/acetate symporter ActP